MGRLVQLADRLWRVSVLIHEGKLDARDVYGALKRREKLIRELRQRLAALEKAGPFPIRTAALKRAGRKVARKAKGRISAATRAAWAAQKLMGSGL